jgi:hypothetical protein
MARRVTVALWLATILGVLVLSLIVYAFILGAATISTRSTFAERSSFEPNAFAPTSPRHSCAR